MEHSSTDRIEQRIELRATPGRVWRALTDYREFGEWFGVRLEGPFVVGQAVRGRITYPGYEHLVMEVMVRAMEAERVFAYDWHPYAVDPKVDYSAEPPTRVEFRLTPTADGGGTVLIVTESGFDRLPAARRAEAFRMNEGGWAQQVKNVEAYVGRNP